MKNTIQKSVLLLLAIAMIFGVQQLQAQLWKKLKDKVQQTVSDHLVDKAGNSTSHAMDKAEDVTKATVRKSAKGDKNKEAETDSEPSAAMGTVRDYKNYDFVPGDKILFEPDMRNEQDAELPDRFTVINGNAEIQSYEGEKVLHLDKGGHAIVTPLMNSGHYLPNQFTIELDMMYENDGEPFKFNTFSIELRKKEDDNFGSTPLHNLLVVSNDNLEWGDVNASRNQLPDAVKNTLMKKDTWHHFAIYVRGNIAKGYIDQYRVAASNNLPSGIGLMDIKTNGNYGIKIKNFRIAEGGDDKYNRLMTDGRFVTHGILFDINKSTIKPISMGTINEVTKLMKSHSDLKLEIDGYTDSDGDSNANLVLSESRAGAVKEKLIEMGIEATRLSTKGYGATKPIDKNDTAEGKANNRRVEFVKL